MRAIHALILVAALAVAPASARRRGLPEKPVPLGAGDPALAGKSADYAHFSELVASVLMLREGGVDNAMAAIPRVHDETKAYIDTVALLAANPSKFNASAWGGLTDKQLAKFGGKKNWTMGADDPLTAWGATVEAKLNATGKLATDAAMDAKANATTAAVQALADKIAPADDAFVAQLNEKLNKYNIEVTGTQDVSPPSKFANGAALISRAITGVSLGATAVSFAPCLVSYSMTGLSFGATGVNVAPVGLQMSAAASTISVQGANIQPSLILVQPIGSNVQPQGMQVAPFLIAVSPVGANVQPQGLNIAPVDTSVTPVGKSIAPAGKVTAPVQIAYAPVDIDLNPDEDAEGKPIDSGDASPGSDIPPPPGRRLLAGGAAGEKFTISPDPLDLSNAFPADFRNWASLLSQVLLRKEGGPEAADAALARVMVDAHAHLARAAAGEPFIPRFHLTDPIFTADAAPHLPGDGGKSMGLPALEATKFASGAQFMEFAPCVLSEGYTGVDAGITGLAINPALVSISAALAANEIVGVNLNPNLIFLSALGSQVNPQGFNVQPALLYVGPIGVNVQPQGANIQPTSIAVSPVGVGVQPVGRLIAPARKVIAPVHMAYGPVKEDTLEGSGVPNPLIDLAEEAREAAAG